MPQRVSEMGGRVRALVKRQQREEGSIEAMRREHEGGRSRSLLHLRRR